jgi:hypothetical protein
MTGERTEPTDQTEWIGTAEPTGRSSASEAAAETGHGVTFWIGLVLGVAIMAYGVKGLLGASDATQPPDLARFFIGAGIVHDAVFAPIVVLVGWLTLKVLPPVARNPVRIALALSVVLVVFTWPLVRRWGARDSNPSLLPLDYGRNVVVGLIVVWVVTGVAVVVRLVMARRARA